MTSTTTIRTTDSLAVSTTKRIRRTLTAVVVGLCAILALPGTALAYTDPNRSVSTTVPIASPAAYQTPASQASSSGWGLTTTLMVVVIAVLAVGIVVVGQRVARRRRAAHLTALGA
jgi:hypothetical protein